MKKLLGIVVLGLFIAVQSHTAEKETIVKSLLGQYDKEITNIDEEISKLAEKVTLRSIGWYGNLWKEKDMKIVQKIFQQLLGPNTYVESAGNDDGPKKEKRKIKYYFLPSFSLTYDPIIIDVKEKEKKINQLDPLKTEKAKSEAEKIKQDIQDTKNKQYSKQLGNLTNSSDFRNAVKLFQAKWKDLSKSEKATLKSLGWSKSLWKKNKKQFELLKIEKSKLDSKKIKYATIRDMLTDLAENNISSENNMPIVRKGLDQYDKEIVSLDEKISKLKRKDINNKQLGVLKIEKEKFAKERKFMIIINLSYANLISGVFSSSAGAGHCVLESCKVAGAIIGDAVAASKGGSFWDGALEGAIKGEKEKEQDINNKNMVIVESLLSNIPTHYYPLLDQEKIKQVKKKVIAKKKKSKKKAIAEKKKAKRKVIAETKKAKRKITADTRKDLKKTLSEIKKAKKKKKILKKKKKVRKKKAVVKRKPVKKKKVIKRKPVKKKKVIKRKPVKKKKKTRKKKEKSKK